MTAIHFLPFPPDERFAGLESVVAGVLAGGAPEPSWVAIDDGSGRWAATAAERPAVERVGGVVAAANDDCLLVAQKLGIGGAMWLPPAHLGAIDAFESANSAPDAVRDFDPVVVELLEPGSPIQIVTVADLGFWRMQLGERALRSFLTELAEMVDRPAVTLPWPAVAVVGESRLEISEAWAELAAENRQARPELAFASLEVGTGSDGVLSDLYRSVAEVSTSADAEVLLPNPVHELPGGRLVGWWMHHPGVERPTDGTWSAEPIAIERDRSRWKLDSPEGPGVVEDVLTTTDLDAVNDAAAVRLPGWAARDLRSGSPAGLLARRLAEAAFRRELPLWIPNVDQDSLRFVLSLPGTLWIDGPAVPRQEG